MIPIILSFFFETGILLNSNAALYQDLLLEELVYMDQPFYTDLGCEFQIGFLFIGGGIYTAVWKSQDNRTFFPYSTNYNFTAGLDFDWLRIGYEHNCFHPVSPGFLIHSGWNGSQDKLFIRLGAEIQVQ